MSDKKQSLKPKDLLAKAIDFGRKLQRYTIVGFVVIVGASYGFVIYGINTLSNQQPSSNAVSSQVQAAKVPRIDPSVVQQLNSLQDNSVSVQTLFNQARSNPFQQ